MGSLVSTRRQGHVLVVSMQREEKRNAVNRVLATRSTRRSTLSMTMGICGWAS